MIVTLVPPAMGPSHGPTSCRRPMPCTSLTPVGRARARARVRVRVRVRGRIQACVGAGGAGVEGCSHDVEEAQRRIGARVVHAVDAHLVRVRLRVRVRVRVGVKAGVTRHGRGNAAHATSLEGGGRLDHRAAAIRGEAYEACA
eukprot:scaffold84513_cov36-Phaeocystis_antarctica.AAC.1